VALSTFSDLKDAILDHLDRPDLVAFDDDFLKIGENRIYRDLRIRAMEAAYSAVISSGSASLPSDYVELKSAYVNSSPTRALERATVEFIYKQYPTRSAEGKPRYIAREGSSFIFGPYPDDSYTINGIYYKRLTALSSSNTTNWFTDNAPEILLYAGLCAAEKFLGNDARVPLWNSMYETLREAIQAEDRKEQFSGSGLRMVAF